MNTDDKLVVREVLRDITLEQIVKIYSGRPGCACGCKGSYTEGVKGKTKLKNMKAFVDYWVPEALDCFVGKDLDENEYISFQTDEKVYTVYFKGSQS